VRRDLLGVLRCPRTGQPLGLEAHDIAGDEVESGLLTSDGGVYPVVAGIPVFTPAGEGAVDELRAGRPARAVAEVFCASSAGSRRWRAATALAGTSALRGSLRAVGSSVRRREVDAVAELLDRPDLGVLDILGGAFLRGRAPMADAHEYFRYRLGTPRHLVVLSVLEALPEPEGMVGDFGCGGGHLTWAMARRWPKADVVAMDLDFRLLLAARRMVGPRPVLVCADITAAPVASGALDVSLSSDVLSYVPDKWAVAREMERVLAPSGTLAITSVKDSAAEHAFAGLPLPLDAWRGLVDHLDHRLVSDDLILERYRDGKGLPSDDGTGDGPVSRNVTALASRERLDLACDTGFDDWPHARGELGLNPLYQAVAGDGTGGRTYSRHLPGGVFVRDNPEVETYLPAEVDLDADTLAAVRRGERPAALEPYLAAAAVLAYPDAYASERWPAPTPAVSASP
jgi:SAM-dependent methyltransferase/uncharacterized protein YbaR (Trm112 family)